MVTPHLKSFVATNFRAFGHLEIPHLHQVNLIVGKNSVGKSCLLEALDVYAKGGSWSSVREILASRSEMQRHKGVLQRQESPTLQTELSMTLDGLSHLFYRHVDLSQDSPKIVLGPLNDRDMQITIRVRWLTRSEGSSTVIRNGVTQNVGESEPFYEVRVGGDKSRTRTMPIGNTRLWFVRDEAEETSIFVSANNLTSDQVERYWDAVSLTDLESEVLASLHVVIQGVKGLSLIGSLVGKRTPIVRLEGTGKPVPLKSLGDGMMRMFGITLAAVNARNGILLIDEVENGLHYSVQLDMWNLLFHLAHKLNVQIFATSHSWDCIQAFQQVASRRKDVEGELIRLDRKGDRVIPTLFDEEELEIVTREQIEVR